MCGTRTHERLHDRLLCVVVEGVLFACQSGCVCIFVRAVLFLSVKGLLWVCDVRRRAEESSLRERVVALLDSCDKSTLYDVN